LASSGDKAMPPVYTAGPWLQKLYALWMLVQSARLVSHIQMPWQAAPHGKGSFAKKRVRARFEMTCLP
jgi:hypothetical protein